MFFMPLHVRACVARACHAKVEVATERKQGWRLVPRSPGGRSPLSPILSSHLTCRPAGPQFPSLMSEGFRQGPSQGPCSLDSGCGAHSAELGAQSQLWQSPAATPSVQKVGASAGP